MRTVKSLIEELKKFPQDANCFAYDGEIQGVVVQSGHSLDNQIGYVPCGERYDEEHSPATNMENKPYLTNAEEGID